MGQPVNEPIMGFAPGSPEREALQNEMDRQLGEVIEIPCVVNGELIFTGNTVTQVVPHDHGHILANVHLAGREEIEAAWCCLNSSTRMIFPFMLVSKMIGRGGDVTNRGIVP